MEQRDFFISYTNADEAWAVWIANVLKSNGYTAYVQALDIGPGDNFLEKMEDFLENSANFIAVWSEAYSQSRYCMTEFRAAFQDWKEGRMGCLLPVRVDESSMKRLYAGLVRVDLSDRGAASETKLVNAVHYAIAPLEEAETLYLRGTDYELGQNGVTQDFVKAKEYYEQAASKGYVLAIKCIGYLYEAGLGLARDYAKAREYYKQAAAKGNAIALYRLGILYENGYGVNVDYAKALEYYRKAVNKGDIRAPAKVRELRKKLDGK